MKKATGVVMKVYNKYVCVRTVKGEFINIKLKAYTPNTGDIYTGAIYNGDSTLAVGGIFVACIIAVMLVGQNIYYYFTPASTVIVDIPPTIQLKINKWDKIIDVKTFKLSGKNLVDPLKLKNKSINTGLEALITEAKNQKTINDYHIKDKNPITIYISNKDNRVIDLVEFDNFMKHQELKYQINTNGTGTIK
ncbi:anti-sigma-I factor RsgI family protein [Clostridium sp. ZS2-4]|uniref:anti-sigma-I factor RsgI family protein n=1 Tax=Clostridium sp. ZS2-4 TaxID=2987703 RepID=UPI00227A96AF|nr:anti-sigma factor domain-containing protein [Clostridium sp. ZS2-4]MCY6354905.1 anti-sigma factor domain-containing protein [Clostridium sp. ZS2-4]